MLLSAAVVAAAANAAPDGSAACRAALDALAGSEVAAAEARVARGPDDASTRAALVAVQMARRSAARLCLRVAAPAAETAETAETAGCEPLARAAAGVDGRVCATPLPPAAPGVAPAVAVPLPVGGLLPAVVPPPGLVPPPAALPPALVRPAPAAVQPAPPPRVVGCDASGCWADDGTRLPRAGGLLIGPRGLCSVAGAAVVCP